MSVKVAVGSKIYDVSKFFDEESDELLRLAKSLNYRVNEVISAFGIYDQEVALLFSSLSLLEEVESIKNNLKQEELFPEYSAESLNISDEKMYSKDEVEKMMLDLISSLTTKLKRALL
jgi:hypothetical protein